MSGTFTQLYLHVVFSTRGRTEWISPEVEERLYPFAGGVLRDLKCKPIQIGGVTDHLHGLFIFRTDLTIADLLRHFKTRTSRWIHETFPQLRAFAWQEGYGAFTVSRSQLDIVQEYIRTQKEHHRTMTFKEEYLKLLRAHSVEFDERYVFD